MPNNKHIQVTDWCKSKQELDFAVNQLKRHGSRHEIGQRGKWFAVFRPRKDILPRNEAMVALRNRSENGSSLLGMTAGRMGVAVTEILQSRREYKPAGFR